MIWWHRVGQKVVCVDLSPMLLSDGNQHLLLKQNAIYKISAVELGPRSGTVCFNFEGISGRHLFKAARFKPVRDTSIESLRELLNPTPEQKREVFQEMIEEKQRELAR